MANNEIVGLTSQYYGAVNSPMRGFAPASMGQADPAVNTLQRGFATLDNSIRQLSNSIVSMSQGTRGLPSYNQAAFTTPNSFMYGPMDVPAYASLFPGLYRSPTGMMPMEWQGYARSMGIQKSLTTTGDIASTAALFAGPMGLLASLGWNLAGKPMMEAAYPISQIATFAQASENTRWLSNSKMVSPTDIMLGGSAQLSEAASKYFEIASLGRDQNYVSSRDYDTVVKSFLSSGLVDFTTEDVKGLRESINENLKTVKELADILHTTVIDSSKTLSGMRASGLIGPAATQTAMMARAVGLQTGMPASSLLNYGSQAASYLVETGLAPSTGYGMVNSLASAMGAGSSSSPGLSSLITSVGGSEQALSRVLNSITGFINSPNAMYLLGFMEQGVNGSLNFSQNAASATSPFSVIAGQAGLVAAQTGIVTPYDAVAKIGEAANANPDALLMTIAGLVRSAVDELAVITGNRDTAITLAGRNFGMAANDARLLLSVATPENMAVAQQVQTNAMITEAINSDVTRQMGETRNWWDYLAPSYWAPRVGDFFLSPLRNIQQNLQSSADRYSAYTTEQQYRDWGYSRTNYGGLTPYVTGSLEDRMRLIELANAYGMDVDTLSSVGQSTVRRELPLGVTEQILRMTAAGEYPDLGLSSAVEGRISDLLFAHSSQASLLDRKNELSLIGSSPAVVPTGVTGDQVLPQLRRYLPAGNDTYSDRDYDTAAARYISAETGLSEDYAQTLVNSVDTRLPGKTYEESVASQLADINMEYLYLTPHSATTRDVSAYGQIKTAAGETYYRVPVAEAVAQLEKEPDFPAILLSNADLAAAGAELSAPGWLSDITKRGRTSTVYDPMWSYFTGTDMDKYDAFINRNLAGVTPDELQAQGHSVTETEAAVMALGMFYGKDALSSAANVPIGGNNPFYTGARFIAAFGTEGDMLAEAALYRGIERWETQTGKQLEELTAADLSSLIGYMSDEELAALASSLPVEYTGGTATWGALKDILSNAGDSVNPEVRESVLGLANRVLQNRAVFNIMSESPGGFGAIDLSGINAAATALPGVFGVDQYNSDLLRLRSAAATPGSGELPGEYRVLPATEQLDNLLKMREREFEVFKRENDAYKKYVKVHMAYTGLDLESSGAVAAPGTLDPIFTAEYQTVSDLYEADYEKLTEMEAQLEVLHNATNETADAYGDALRLLRGIEKESVQQEETLELGKINIPDDITAAGRDNIRDLPVNMSPEQSATSQDIAGKRELLEENVRQLKEKLMDKQMQEILFTAETERLKDKLRNDATQMEVLQTQKFEAEKKLSTAYEAAKLAEIISLEPIDTQIRNLELSIENGTAPEGAMYKTPDAYGVLLGYDLIGGKVASLGGAGSDAEILTAASNIYDITRGFMAAKAGASGLDYDIKYSRVAEDIGFIPFSLSAEDMENSPGSTANMYMLAASMYDEALTLSGGDVAKAKSMFIGSEVFGEYAAEVVDTVANYELQKPVSGLETMNAAVRTGAVLTYDIRSTAQANRSVLDYMELVDNSAKLYASKALTIAREEKTVGTAARGALMEAYTELARYTESDRLLNNYGLVQEAYDATDATLPARERLLAAAGLLTDAGSPVTEMHLPRRLAEKGRFALFAFNELYAETAGTPEERYAQTKQNIEGLYTEFGMPLETVQALVEELPTESEAQLLEKGNIFYAVASGMVASDANKLYKTSGILDQFQSHDDYYRMIEAVRLKYGDDAVADVVSYGRTVQNMSTFMADETINADEMDLYRRGIFNPLMNIATRTGDANLKILAGAGNTVFDIAYKIQAGELDTTSDIVAAIRASGELSSLGEDTLEAIIDNVQGMSPQEAARFLTHNVGISLGMTGLETTGFFSKEADFTTEKAFATAADIRSGRYYEAASSSTLPEMMGIFSGEEERTELLTTGTESLVEAISSLDATLSGDDSRMNSLLVKLDELIVAINNSKLADKGD